MVILMAKVLLLVGIAVAGLALCWRLGSASAACQPSRGSISCGPRCCGPRPARGGRRSSRPARSPGRPSRSGSTCRSPGAATPARASRTAPARCPGRAPLRAARCVAGRGRGTHEAEPGSPAVRRRSRSSRSPRAPTRARSPRRACGPGRTTSCRRGDHLASDDRVCLQRARGAEVAHQPAGRPGPATLHRDVGCRQVVQRLRPLGAGPTDREAPPGRLRPTDCPIPMYATSVGPAKTPVRAGQVTARASRRH